MRTRAGVVPPIAAPLAGVANVGGGSGLDPTPGVIRLPRLPMTAMPSSPSVSCATGAVCVAASPPRASGGTTPARSRSASISSSATVLSRGVVAARGDAPRGDGLASSMRPAVPIPPRAPRVARPNRHSCPQIGLKQRLGGPSGRRVLKVLLLQTFELFARTKRKFRTRLTNHTLNSPIRLYVSWVILSLTERLLLFSFVGHVLSIFIVERGVPGENADRPRPRPCRRSTSATTGSA